MGDHLDRYRKMRDFGKTPEPKGARRTRKKPDPRPTFVVQKHRASHLHYDFRLEIDGVLKSWAVPKGPSYDPSVKRLAMMTEDHPMEYGSFEGVIPPGNYGAGNVIIWDEGEWEYIDPGNDPSDGLSEGKMTFMLFGKKLFGEWALIKLSGERSKKGNEWLLLKHRDEWANQEVDVTEVAPLSVVSNRGVEELDETDERWESNRNADGSAKKTGAAKRKRSTKKTKKQSAAAGSSRSGSRKASKSNAGSKTAKRSKK